MIKWLVLMLFVATIAADIYIYRGIVCRCFRRLPARVSYIIFAFLSDGLALAAFCLYLYPDLHAHSIVAVMWMLWTFGLVALPKLFFALGAFLDRLTGAAVHRRVLVFRILALAASVALVVTMVCGATVGRNKFRVVDYGLQEERLPAGFDGYRIVQISDLHIGTMCNPERQIARIAGLIARLRPDIVVHTGDLVNISAAELTPSVIDKLRLITAPDGVFSVWGNHDLGFYIKGADSLALTENMAELTEKVRAAGWRTLSDESVWIHRGGDSILLSGMDYSHAYSREKLNAHNYTLDGDGGLKATFEGITGNPYSIVLAHTPNMWRAITAKGFGDMTLSGHVHAMQMKIPVFGRDRSPAEWMYDEWSGGYWGPDEKNNFLYVNDGIGCVGYPMRIGAKPEITIFTLERNE